MDSAQNIFFFPELHSYVVFSIDSVATVASHNDPELTRACRLIEHKKYVALVENRHFTHWHLFHGDFALDLLWPGLPPSVPEEYKESTMSVPVAPSTIPHPLGRKALNPSLPLPWQNCYHNSLNDVRVRIPDAWSNAPAPWIYDDVEQLLHRDMFVLDRERCREAREAHAAGLPPLPPPPPHVAKSYDEIFLYEESIRAPKPESEKEYYYRSEMTGEQSERLIYRATGMDYDEPSPPTPEGGWAHFDGESVFASILGKIVQGMEEDLVNPRPDPNASMAIVNVSYDLNAVAHVNDPRDFFKELELLAELQEQAKLRAIERARLSDEKHFGSPQPSEALDCGTNGSLPSMVAPNLPTNDEKSSGEVQPSTRRFVVGAALTKAQRRMAKMFRGITRRGRQLVSALDCTS